MFDSFIEQLVTSIDDRTDAMWSTGWGLLQIKENGEWVSGQITYIKFDYDKDRNEFAHVIARMDDGKLIHVILDGNNRVNRA